MAPKTEAEDIDDKIARRTAEIEAEGGGEDDDREDPEAKPPKDVPVEREDGDEPPAPKSRKDNRWQQMNERTSAAEARAQRAEEQLTQTLSLLQERQRTPEAKKEGADDPFAEKLGQIKRERTLLMREIQAGAGKFTQEQLDAIEKRAETLEEEHVEVLAERLVAKRGLGQPQRQEHPLKPFLALQFPDVVQNPKAVDYARAYFQQQKALGRAETMELVVESHQRAREALRTQPNAPKPDPHGATRRVGMSAGPSAGARDEAATPGLTKEQKKMADSLYSDIPDPNKRYAKWAKGPGARIAAKS